MNPLRDDFTRMFDRVKIKEMTIDVGGLGGEYQCCRFAVMTAVMFHTKVRFELNQQMLAADGRDLSTLMSVEGKGDGEAKT
jgi:hypothetical protein